MKKIIILLIALLMSACSALKPAETLSSMQTEPTASETTVAEKAAPEETTELAPKETETVTEAPKEEPAVPPVVERPEQKPAPETTATTVEAPVEPIYTVTTAEPPTTPKTPAEAAEAEFDINYWISFARSYALQIGLEIDPTAVDCWDNPTTANADCIYLERDLTHRLDRYNRDDDITAVNIWAESLGNRNYLIYIAYA